MWHAGKEDLAHIIGIMDKMDKKIIPRLYG
jgi:hypothetical protein